MGFAWVIISAFLANEINFAILAAVSLPLGAFAGLGIPICLAVFSEAVTSKNRGRNGAFAFFLIQYCKIPPL